MCVRARARVCMCERECARVRLVHGRLCVCLGGGGVRVHECVHMSVTRLVYMHAHVCVCRFVTMAVCVYINISIYKYIYIYIYISNALCRGSSVVIVFAHGAMGRRIDRSLWTH